MIIAVVIGLILAALTYVVLDKFLDDLFVALLAILVFVLCVYNGEGL